MTRELYEAPAIYIDGLRLSNYALAAVVVLLLALIALLLLGIPFAIRLVRRRLA